MVSGEGVGISTTSGRSEELTGPPIEGALLTRLTDASGEEGAVVTLFYRRGHFRTSRLGTQHWVEGHDVERDDWERSSYSYHEPDPRLLRMLREYDADNSRTACFIRPNARCPVCGESVFYYQNEHGSRVFFDELGPPWPKHPCTDLSNTGQHRRSRAKRSEPLEPRSIIEIAEIRTLKMETDCNDDELFQERYGARPWEVMVVEKRFRAPDENLIVARSLEKEGLRYFYFSFYSKRRYLEPGEVFLRKRKEISFFDESTGRICQFPIHVYRRVSHFIDSIPSD